jgi:hypothetical protein
VPNIYISFGGIVFGLASTSLYLEEEVVSLEKGNEDSLEEPEP